MSHVSESLTLGKDRDDSRLSYRRRLVLSAAGLAIPATALEIGACDNPTIRERDGFAVRYADYFSGEELRRTHASNPRRDASRIVDVDYVVKGPLISPYIHEQMELVVANHVIEHICNPINWLRDIASICSPEAAIFLAVPDQRFTFDYLKQPTDITNIVRAYEERKVQPDAYDVARMRYLHTRVDAGALWEGGAPPVAPSQTTASYRSILERARADAESAYTDVHCMFFTSDSFVHIFSELHRSGYIPWQVKLLCDVERGGNEFYVLLERDDASSEQVNGAA